jgi:hypothetical protein
MQIKLILIFALLFIGCCSRYSMIDYTNVFHNEHVKNVEKININVDCQQNIEKMVKDSMHLTIYYPEYFKINNTERALHFWNQEEIYNKNTNKRQGTEYLIIFNEQCVVNDTIKYQYYK